MKPKNNRIAHRLLSHWHQKVLALVASLVIYFFYRVGTQTELRVPLADPKTPAGYAIAREWPREVTLVFRGAQGKFSADDFRATVDVSGFAQSGTVRGEVKVEIVNDAVRRNPPDFSFSPTAIEFVLERVAEKYAPVDVKAGVTGTLPPGYLLESLSWSPQSVLVRGPKSLVDKLASVRTEPVDLSGRRGPFTLPVRIGLPSDLLRAVDAESVTVTAVIRGTRTIDNVRLIPTGLRPDLEAGETPMGKIEVQGTETLVEGLDPAKIALAVDCRAVDGPGEYALAVSKPELPPGLAAEGIVTDWEPKQVKLRFERKDKDGAP